MASLDYKTWKKKGIYVGLSSILIVCTAFIYTYLAKQDSGFDPVEALPYEALMLSEDSGSLDLHTADRKDIQTFLTSYKDFKFNPFILNLSDDCRFHGASIIDYEFTKIAVVKFQNIATSRFFFHFTFAGSIKDLTPGKVEKEGSFNFESYSSEEANFIIWQQDPKTLSMLLGYVPTAELVQIALRSMEDLGKGKLGGETEDSAH